MHKEIKKQSNGWYVVYQVLECMKHGIYRGSYKSLEKAQSDHPNAKYNE